MQSTELKPTRTNQNLDEAEAELRLHLNCSKKWKNILQTAKKKLNLTDSVRGYWRVSYMKNIFVCINCLQLQTNLKTEGNFFNAT